MSLGSILGKIGAGIAAPFTGGASLAAIPILDAIGTSTSGAAAGAAQGRRDDSASQVLAQNSNLTGARDAYSAGLSGAQFNASEQDRAAKRAILASLLGGINDASISRPANSTIPTFQVNGGLRPSAMTNKDALIAMLNQPTMTAPTYQGPKPLDLPKAGVLENVLGGVGMGSNILGGILGGIQKAKATPQMIGNDLPSQGGIAGNLPRPGVINPALLGNVTF